MKKLLFTLFAATIVLISSCKKEDQTSTDPKAVIVVNSTAVPLDTVYVDGTKSENADNYEWTGLGPDGNFTLQSTNTEGKVFFIPTKNGSWQITLNVTYQGKYNTTTKNVAVSGAIKIGGTLTQNMTLTDLSYGTDSCDYFLTEDLIVPSGKFLTIEDGVKICVAEDVAIIVEGRLDVKGGSYGVVMEPLGNNWKGIHIKNMYTSLKYLTITGAGSSSFTANPDDKAAIFAESTFLASLLTVKNSAGYGVIQKTKSVSFEQQSGGFTFENNASGPGIFSLDAMKYSTSFDLTNETYGTYIKLLGDIGSLINFRTDLEFPYMLLGDIQVNSLQLYPGTKMICADGVGIQVETALVTIDNGSSGSILIEGVTKSPGSWKGIYVKQNALLKDLTIKHAGSSTWQSQFLGDVKAGLLVEGKVEIEGSTFDYNGGYGLAAINNGQQNLNKLSSTSISNNTDGAMLVDFYMVGYLLSTGDLQFNGYGAQPIVTIYRGLYSASKYVGTWPKISAAVSSTDYRFMTYSTQGYSVTQDWTIEKGVRIVCDADVAIQLGYGINLTAIGTNSEKITFTGASSTPGYWLGLRIENSCTINCEYMEVLYGGKYANGIYSGCLNVSSLANASSTVKNCTFLNGGTLDLWFENGTDVIGIKDPLNNNIFVNSN